MQLEWRATAHQSSDIAPYDIEIIASTEADAPLVIDTRPLFAGIAADARRGRQATAIARRFHVTLAGMMVTVCRRIRDRSGLGAVVLSGGVFQNALLTTLAVTALEKEGFRVYRHRQVPPGDGGLCLGQVAVAAACGTSATAAGQHRTRRNRRPLDEELLMCLAIPGKVVETYREHDVRMGKVDFGGILKKVCLEHVPEAGLDDYVLVHVGFALRESTRPRR